MIEIIRQLKRYGSRKAACLFIVLSAIYLPVNAQILDQTHLKVVTFNVQRHDYSYAAQFTDFISGRPTVQSRVNATIERLEEINADIIALQEATPRFIKALIQADRLSQYDIVHSFRKEQLEESNYLQDPIGQAILSRFPISNSRSKPLAGSRLARQYLQASININGHLLLVTNIHLDSLPEDGAIRAAQLDQVIKLNRYVDNAIIIGDFNFSDQQQPESNHLPDDYIDAWLTLRTDDQGITYDDNKERGRLDRILIRSPRWKPVKVDVLYKNSFNYNNRTFPLSDHRAVLMHLSLEPG